MTTRRSSPTQSQGAVPSTSELRDLIAHLLAGAAGGSEAKWRKLVGDVEALPIIFDPRSNWRIEPTGTASELEAIEKAVTVVRGAHLYVPSPRSK